MKKIVILIVIFIAFSTSVFLSVKNDRLVQEISLLKKENVETRKALEKNSIYISSLQKQTQEQLRQNINELYSQQISASPSAQKESGIYISAVESTQQKEEGVQYLTFWVKGSNTMPFDAMDLGLSLTNIRGPHLCTTGEVFSQYPIIAMKETGLVITGIARLNGNKIETGVVNKQFASCLFRKKDPSQKAKVALDPAKTHIYSLGKSVLNLERSFKENIW